MIKKFFSGPKKTPSGGDGIAKRDILRLCENSYIENMLVKIGDNDPNPEVVYFSDFVVKINKKGKHQTRVMLITDKALYNCMPNDWAKCKRRVPVERVASTTISQVSDEFVLHIPDEYDYHYKSSNKDYIAGLVDKLYSTRIKRIGGTSRMKILQVQKSDLSDHTYYKCMAKEITHMSKRAEELQKHKEDPQPIPESEKEDETHQEGDTENLLKDREQVDINSFELLKVIGRGSFGKVLLVKHRTTGKVYAMKILKKDAIVARNQVEHTKAERSILQALQHPFLMGLHYAFQTKEKLYFVLDYMRGGELFFHLKRKRRFSENEARIWIAEISLALGHLHALDVIYRDLKPENILLDEKGHVRLTDFGLSKDITPAHQKAHTFCGTPEYLAPEIVMGVGHGKDVDWWSLGILLYELTVGIPPFYSNNVNDMYHKIQHGVLRFPPYLSEKCKMLIIQLLHRDPRMRLGSGKSDVEAIKSNPFFKNINWEKLYNKQIDSPFKPFTKSETDTRNFDAQFTDEVPCDSLEYKGKLQTAGEDEFQGFTFVPDDSMLKNP